jgi:hypothetical protein
MKNSTIIATVALVTSLTLAGCTSSLVNDGETTLLDTKQASQLIRNNITGQISSDATEDITEVQDESVACNGDEEGLMRSWRSSARTQLVAERASKATAIVQTIAGGLVSKGWTSSAEETEGGGLAVDLEKSDALASIRITSTEGDGASILVEVIGRCVLTDGPGSDELATLED